MRNRILSGLLIIAFMFSLMGCNQTSSKDANNPTENITDIDNVIDKNDENDGNEIVEFKDFLVERCVRKELNYDWDEDITQKELEGITSLCISSMYDPTFSESRNTISELMYRGYIDLCDLKYLKNLEELRIDAFINSDSIVNLDSVTECKKLKKVYIPCSLESINSINPLGYKYWQNIVSELPELEYLDLGLYFDEHMKEVVLSKTNKKDIEFYSGPKGDWRNNDVETFFYQTYTPQDYSEIRMIYEDKMETISNYEEAWDFEYKSIIDRIESIRSTNCVGWLFPTIYADNMLELETELENLSENTEDIIIVYDSKDEFDFSVFEKFSNLVTLTVFATEFEQEKYVDSGTFTIVEGDYVGTSAINLSSLSNNEKLQVLNLAGFVGDISDITQIQNLRELSIVMCAMDSVEFISELTSVNELVLELFTDGSEEEFYSNIDNEVSTLRGLRCYVDDNYNAPDNIDSYRNINDMESLETLFIVHDCFLNNIVQSKTIKNLHVSFGMKELNNLSFEQMKNLEVLVLSGGSDVNYSSIIELPNIKSVVYPSSMAKNSGHVDVLTYDLAQKIEENDNISSFKMNVSSDFGYLYNSETDREFIWKLYEAGVDEGIFQRYIRGGWGGNVELTFDDFCYAYGY